jgi:single-strand DNA-binding protein
MFCKNRITLIGFIGHDAETRYTSKGTPYTRLSLATSISWKETESDAYRSRTEWHQIVVWGRLGEWAGTLKKGSFVEVEGEVRYHEYQPKGSDAKARATEIHASSILTLDRAEKADAAETATAEVPTDSDTPF